MRITRARRRGDLLLVTLAIGPTERERLVAGTNGDSLAERIVGQLTNTVRAFATRDEQNAFVYPTPLDATTAGTADAPQA